jgi:hypothetical protein
VCNAMVVFSINGEIILMMKVIFTIRLQANPHYDEPADRTTPTSGRGRGPASASAPPVSS